MRAQSYTTSELDTPLNEETRGLAEVEAHKPVIERETPHYFKCKDVKANVVRTVKMTIRGITVLEDGTDNVVGHYGFRQIPDFHVGDKRENFYFTYDGANGREKHEFKTKEVRVAPPAVTAVAAVALTFRSDAGGAGRVARPGIEHDWHGDGVRRQARRAAAPGDGQRRVEPRPRLRASRVVDRRARRHMAHRKRCVACVCLCLCVRYMVTCDCVDRSEGELYQKL